MRNVHRVCTECSQNYIPKPNDALFWTWCSWQCARRAWPDFVQGLEGHCFTCNRAIEENRAFCAAPCRERGRSITNDVFAVGSKTPRIFLRCRFCNNAFALPRAEWIRGGGSYCSHGCAGRNAAKDVTANPIDDAFGHWFAGLTDGEASFDISANKEKGNSVRFMLRLRDDDRAVLEHIRDTLGFGAIYTVDTGSQGGAVTNPVANYACVSVKSCDLLRQVFDKYPLRSKKRRDFDIWRVAVEGLRDGTIYHEEASRLRGLLISGRAYQKK